MEANGNTTPTTAALYLRKSNIDERAGDNCTTIICLDAPSISMW
jgi:hypothetical protein|tara:strand:- start:451 stop:582 length:132 start_codon:yes stop_codon:yes gene_type:complete